LIKIKAMEKVKPSGKGTADPLFQGIGSRICIMENEKNSSMGLYEKHSLFGITSPLGDKH
jgi:hypothetical protein